MWNNLTQLSVSPINLALRATAVYFFILILLRMSGKRQMGQMSATEFVAVLLISNAVQNAMNAGDNSLSGGLLLAAVLMFLSWLVSLLTFKSKRFSAIFEGTPSVLVRKGRLVKENLDREYMTITELKMLLRKQGIHHLDEVHTLIYEADGTISVTKSTEIK